MPRKGSKVMFQADGATFEAEVLEAFPGDLLRLKIKTGIPSVHFFKNRAAKGTASGTWRELTNGERGLHISDVPKPQPIPMQQHYDWGYECDQRDRFLNI